MFSLKLRLIRKASSIRSLSPQTCKLCHRALTKENDVPSPQLTERVLRELQKKLECPKSLARHIAVTSLKSRQASVEEVRENIYSCLSTFRRGTLVNNPEWLTIDPIVLHNRIKILHESQFKEKVRVLCNFEACRKVDIDLLKAHRLIDDDADVIGSLLSSIGNAHLLRLPPLNERQRLDDVYLSIMKAYLSWKLQIPETDLNFIGRFCIWDLSIQQFKFNILFLLNKAGFSRQMVLENFKYVRRMSCASLLGLIDFFESKGYNFLEMLRQKPQLITLPYYKSCQTLNILEEFNISFEMAFNVPKVFTLPPDDLRKKLEIVCSHKELKLFKFHPRFLQMVFRIPHVFKRLELQKNLEHVKLSFSYLVDDVASNHLSKLQTGVDDLLIYLSKSLGRQTRDIRTKLMRHKYWRTVPLSQVDETLRFLLDNHFSKNLIYDALHIVLYPRIRVEHELICLNRRNLRECRNESDNIVKKELVLPLVLYFIEKETKFSGAGVWIENLFSKLEDDTELEDEHHEDAYPNYFKNRLHKVISESVNNSETVSDSNSKQSRSHS